MPVKIEVPPGFNAVEALQTIEDLKKTNAEIATENGKLRGLLRMRESERENLSYEVAQACAAWFEGLRAHGDRFALIEVD